MESTTILSMGAVACFIVYYELVTESYITRLSTNGIVVSHQLNAICSLQVGYID